MACAYRRLLPWKTATGVAVALVFTRVLAAPADLRVGIAGHAFDHLGTIGDQASTAARSGANIIYVTGVGAVGYGGLPAAAELSKQEQATRDYVKEAKRNGIRLAMGYVCATSIVKLNRFDLHWPRELRRQFHEPPSEWRQQDRQGKPLKSWYGGDYEAACMNNPDWRAYECFVVRQQLEAGCGGIFFDNPTVHPNGCFCHWCMERFAEFIKQEREAPAVESASAIERVEALRAFAVMHHEFFLRFRCGIARAFLAEMRRYARTIKPTALVTANNSLNSAGVESAHCRSNAYNLSEMSTAEDFVVVEDMSSQPRALAGGQAIEYGPTYEQLLAISHGKPVVAVTLADANYHTPPNLVRLAMAEAAANRASYLLWATWPMEQRERMISAVRPEADFLRQHADLLNKATMRQDVTLFLPFRKWIETEDCAPSRLAAELSRANVQYAVICEDELPAFLLNKKDLRSKPQPKRARILLVENHKVFLPTERHMVDQFVGRGGSLVIAEKGDWLERVRRIDSGPSLIVSGPATIRARAVDEPDRTIVHLLNLDVQRISSFKDKVTPAREVRIKVRVPFDRIRRVRALTPDVEASSSGLLNFSQDQSDASWVQVQVPEVEISTLLVIE